MAAPSKSLFDRKEKKSDDGKKDSKSDAKGPMSDKKEITIQLPAFSFDFGPQFQLKLILLGLIALLYLFALFLFTRSSFFTSDLFNLSRLQYNIPKLYSIAFILFTLTYSLAMSVAVYYGFGLKKLQAALPLPLLLILGLVYGLLAPPFLLPFIAFGIAVAGASIASSFAKDLNFSSAWAATSKALMVLLVLSLLFTYMKVSANRDMYFDVFLGGVSEVAPQIAGNALPAGLSACADALDQITLTPDMAKNYVSVDNVSAALAQSGSAGFGALPASDQQAIATAVYSTCVTQAATVANGLKGQVSKGLRNVNASAIAGSNATSSLFSASALRRTFSSVPEFQLVQDSFPLIAVASVLSIVSLFNFVVHLLASVLLWLLMKVMG